MSLRDISWIELRERLTEGDDLALIDVAPLSMFHQYHLPGAVHVKLGPDFEREVRTLIPTPERELVVYGSVRFEHHPQAAARRLQRAGYRHVSALADGRESWRRFGCPVESGSL